jgi:hypothetical protein
LTVEVRSKVIAKQKINPDFSSSVFSQQKNFKESVAMHAVSEAYIAAKNSQVRSWFGKRYL